MSQKNKIAAIPASEISGDPPFLPGLSRGISGPNDKPEVGMNSDPALRDYGMLVFSIHFERGREYDHWHLL